MKENNSITIILAIGIVILFIVSAVTPIVFGYKVENTDTELDKLLDNLRFICTDANGFSEKKYNYYKEKLLSQYSSENLRDDTVFQLEKEESTISVYLPFVAMVGGPMDSAWPMKSHDVRHTGQSPYSTVDTYVEKWRFYTGNWVESGSVIDSDGTIYFGCFDRHLYALYPDGTLKWRYKTGGLIWSTPAIAEDGTIYIGSWDDYLHAINPDGTRKWRFPADEISSSPVIAEDGTVYFGVMGPGNKGRVYALYPDGTEKWHYDTGYWIVSDPAIGDDGTIYIGSGDSYFYAMNPDGTLKWRFKTGDEIHGHPSIAEDGTVYIASYDKYLYALYPNNGTMKWKIGVGALVQGGIAIGDDGAIYIGTDKLRAINPNGTLKWSFNIGSDVWIYHSTLAISADGTIYVGTFIGSGAGGEIIAVNSDGTLRWSKKITNYHVDSSPSISEDGTVYIGSSSDDAGYSFGFLHAFGPQETNDPPTAPGITGPTNGIAGTSYDYTFVASDPDRNPISYYVEWGDGATSGWTGDYNTGEEITLSHTWSGEGTFTIKAKTRDTFGAESGWNELTVTMPRNRIATNNLLMGLFEQFPILQKVLLHLIR